METSREDLIRTLQRRNLSDDAYDRIRDSFPISETCPTCNGNKVFALEGSPQACDCEVQMILRKHYFAANIGREYHDICLEHFIGENKDVVSPVVEHYLENFEDKFHYGLGLTFSGPWGTGKTLAMTSVLKELIKRGRDTYFITFDELIDTWGSSWNDEKAKKLLQDKLKRVEVLGLDELKTDKRNMSGFLAAGFDSVIRHRTSNLLPTLITTNLTPQEEQNHFGKGFSLLSARNERILLSGKDYRQGEVRDKIIHLSENHERRPIC